MIRNMHPLTYWIFKSLPRTIALVVLVDVVGCLAIGVALSSCAHAQTATAVQIPPKGDGSIGGDPPPDTRPLMARSVARAHARRVFGRDVSLWHELNAPDRTIAGLYGDDFPFPLPAPPEMKLIDYTVDTLDAWKNVTSTAVVTTRSWYIERVYKRIAHDVPSMTIIPGLKLNMYLDEGVDDLLTDLAMWEAFTADALRCAELTGTNQIVVMAEGQMARFYAGQYVPDVDKFRDAMRPLRESGLRVRWYPVGTHGPLPTEDAVRLVRGILEAVPDSHFVSVGDGFPIRENDPDQNARRVAQFGVTLGRVAHHLFVAGGKRNVYVYADGRTRRAYSPVEFLSWIDRRSVGDVWVFPGTFNAWQVGRELDALLLGRGFRVVSDRLLALRNLPN